MNIITLKITKAITQEMRDEVKNSLTRLYRNSITKFFSTNKREDSLEVFADPHEKGFDIHAYDGTGFFIWRCLWNEDDRLREAGGMASEDIEEVARTLATRDEADFWEAIQHAMDSYEPEDAHTLYEG